MKEELVSFEVAVLLKELGFDWVCHEGWSDRDEGQEPYPIHFEEISSTHVRTYFDNSEEQDCHLYARPAQSLAQKWLRDVKCTYVEIDRYFVNSVFEYQSSFLFSIESVAHEVMGDYPSYEQALEAGLLASLIYLQTNQKENV